MVRKICMQFLSVLMLLLIWDSTNTSAYVEPVPENVCAFSADFSSEGQEEVA